ncbi:MAG: acetate--CoA ligase family protein [Desulfobacterales bacterium]|jgi:succinyl-CoA synthetase beta subunit
MDLINVALDKGQKALSEYESKQLLNAYGIPITKEALATSPEDAVSAAETIGYPVALKACSPQLMHKSESGVIELGIKDQSGVKSAFQKISGLVNSDLDGILVQEMISGQRELVMGLNRDPQFGPCVMFGLGGILTEVLNDTAFRVAPIDEIDALDMISEIRSRAILEAFRGQAPADQKTLCSSLIALAEIGLKYESIAEIDVNPMMIIPDGRVVAVDALVIMSS